MPGSEQSSICDCAAHEDESVLLRVRWTMFWHFVVRVFLHAAVLVIIRGQPAFQTFGNAINFFRRKFASSSQCKNPFAF